LDWWENLQENPIIGTKSFTGWWCNNHLEKYEFVNGKDDYPIYEMENNPVMFETTNQQIVS